MLNLESSSRRRASSSSRLFDAMSTTSRAARAPWFVVLVYSLGMFGAPIPCTPAAKSVQADGETRAGTTVHVFRAPDCTVSVHPGSDDSQYVIDRRLCGSLRAITPSDSS